MTQSGEPQNSKYNVVCFGFMPWGNMWKRNQSMMAEMAKLDFVQNLVFVNPLISLRNLFKEQSNPVYGEGVVRSIFPQTISSKIKVYTPVTWIPFKRYSSILMTIEDRITLTVIRLLNRQRPYILFLNCPNFSSNLIVDELSKGASLTLFDFSDDFSELGYDVATRETFRENSLKYAKKADVVLTVNEHIKRKYSAVNDNIHIVRNATNYKNFDRSRFEPIEKLEVLKKSGKPIIGYSGIANLGRIDSTLLDYLIGNRPHWEFVFVGPAHERFVEKYMSWGNVHIFPPVGYQDLPNYMQYFDVAIVPFKQNENTKGNDLLKLHDYLAMGKAVVSTEIGGSGDLRGVVRIVGTSFEFLMAIEDELNKNDRKDIVRRKASAQKNSWQNRIKELEELVEKNLGLGVQGKKYLNKFTPPNLGN